MAGTKAQVEGLPTYVAISILTATTDAKRSLQGIDTRNIVDRAECYVVENEGLYRYFEESTAADAPPNVVRPTTGPGAWLLRATNDNAGTFEGGKLTNSVAQSVPDSTDTLMEFDTIAIGAAVPTGFCDLVNEALVVPAGRGGLYHVGAASFWGDPGPGYFSRINIVGSVAGLIQLAGDGTPNSQSNVAATIVALAAGETVTLRGLQDSGAPLDASANELWAYRIGNTP